MTIALLEQAAEKAVEKATDRFSACKEAKIESIWERVDKRIDGKVDSKLGPVIDRLSALEKTSTSSTRSGPSSSSDGSAGNFTGPIIFALLTWKSRGGVLLKMLGIRAFPCPRLMMYDGVE